MDYSKVPQEINNIVADNVRRLAQLFPSSVKDGQVDLEALKEELGQFEEVGKEKYELTWAGKQDAKKKAQEDLYNRTLKYIEADTKNPETTENLYIEGDNFEVLNLLRQNYYGAIKMIYIDPPYNTGNDFVYNDKFAMDRQASDIAEGTRDVEGNPLQKNQQSSNRYHANWLNMMYPRLKVAKDLLTDDGVIFISIDDNEADNLKKACDEVFGEMNFESIITWRRRTNQPNDKSKMIAKVAENIVVYSKNSNILASKKAFFGVPLSNERKAEYKNPDHDKKGAWSTNPWKAAVGRGGTKYSITTPTGKVYTETWYGTQDTFKKLELDNRVYWTDNGNGYPRIKIYLKDAEKEGQAAINFFTHERYGSNQEGSAEIEKLFMAKGLFDNPKPTRLVKALTQIITFNDSIILDFFSGSATTAHAVMQLNAEDGGNRKFIMVQLPEETEKNSEAFKAGYKNICEIGKERIRRAGEKIKQEIETTNSQLRLGEEPKQVPDIGFKVFRTADTNIKWNLYNELGQIDAETMAHTPDLADFTYGFSDIDVVYEVMLRQKDVPLSSTLETLTDIGSRTHLYGSAYLVCLETEITEILIDKLAALDPLPIKFIFRDSAFKDDINLKDETFRRLKNLIERNSGLAKKAYTVEFL